MMRKRMLLVGTIIIVLCAVCILLLPTTLHKFGGFFFGKYPALYNITLAQFFYQQATDPLIGKVPSFSHYQLSRTYFIQGEFDLAVAEALLELEKYPENTRTYYILGLTYGYMHRERDAIDAFSKFIEAHPNSWAARNDKAWLQFRIGEVDAALLTLEPVSELPNPWVQNTKGTLLLNTGDVVGAYYAFKSAEIMTNAMTEEGWGSAYPGNDPRIYAVGLEAMRKSIANNLRLIELQEPSLSPAE